MDQDVLFLLDSPKADADASWVQVAKTGKFSDPRYGKFTITTQDFSRWIRNFDSNVGHGELGLPVDVDHSPEKRGDTEAMGWVKRLEQRGNQLWASVEWNDQGKTLIAERRYAYISPSYAGDFKDESGESHGTTLVGIALTNRPFLQMATVNLSKFMFASAPDSDGDNDGDTEGLNTDEITDLDHMDFSAACEGGKTPDGYNDGKALDDVMLDISDAARQKHAVVVKKINGKTQHMFPVPPGDKGHARAALRLLPRAIRAGHITTQEASAIRQRAAGVLGHKSQGGKSLSVPKVVDGTWIADAYSLDQMELDQIINAMGLSREALGVSADAEDSVVLSAMKSHVEKKPAEGSITLSADQVAQLTSDANAGKAAAEELRIGKFETAFTLAQTQGKVVPSQKETFKAIYDQNSDLGLKTLSELQPVISMAPIGSGAGSADLDPDARQLAGQYQDTARTEPMSVDTDGLRIVARAEQIEREHKVDFTVALARAEAELGVAA